MIDLAIALIFVAYCVWAGFASRREASRNLVEYFLAGRTLQGWRAGLSMAATQYAADTPLLVAGLVALGGVYSAWRLWIYGIAFLLMGFVLGRAWRAAGVLTDAELTEVRYSGRAVIWLRALKAIYYGTVINCVVMAFVLVAATRIFEVFLPWHLWLPGSLYEILQGWMAASGLTLWSGSALLTPLVATTNSVISIALTMTFVALYSTTGGLRSVVATDVVQFGIIVVGTLAYAIFAVRAAGGWGEMSAAVAALYGPERAGHMLSFLPPLDEALLPFLVVLSLQWLFQMNSDGTGYLAQRTMGCRSDRDARVAAVVMVLAQIGLRSLLWLPIVIALLVIFPFDPTSGSSDDLTALREMTFVRGMDELLPAGVRGLMLTGMLAALASTLDTHLNWGAGYWSNDLYKAVWVERVRRRVAQPRELVWAARLSNLLVLSIALVIVANLGSIQRGWQISLLFGAGVGSVLMLRWLWERVNLYCEIAAMLVSLLLAPVLLIFVSEDWLRLALMSLASTLAVVAAAYLAPATRPEQLASFYRRVQPPGWWSRTATAIGADPMDSRRLLARGLVSVMLVAVTVYALLIGIGMWIMHPERWALAAAFVALGILAVPYWVRRL